MTRLRLVLIGVLLGVTASGWGAWWLRGRTLAHVRAKLTTTTRALETATGDIARLEASFRRQNQRVSEIAVDAQAREARLQKALKQELDRASQNGLEAARRKAEAERLRERLARLPECVACREAWVALRDHGEEAHNDPE